MQTDTAILARLIRSLVSDLDYADLAKEERENIQSAISEAAEAIAVINGDSEAYTPSGRFPFAHLLREVTRAHERTRGGFHRELRAIGYATEKVVDHG